MAAPSIPNLNTLRSGRGRGRGRGFGLSGPSAASSTVEDKARHDQIVQQTDVDAAVSRLSAVQAGYLDDPYAKFFASPAAQKRFPIINRGTYVRTTAIDQLVDDFLKSHGSQKKQVVSLGAGTDTRYFRLKSRYNVLDDPNWIYHEIDFEENAIRKVRSVSKETALAGLVGTSATYSGLTDEPHRYSIINAPNYHIHPIDLRTLDPLKSPRSSFASLDPSLPTIILSECCLCYLPPAEADAAVKYFTKSFFSSDTPIGMIVYEPIKPNDAFGRTMVSNLAARGIEMQTLKKYGSLEAQAARLQSYGFEQSREADINQLWKAIISEEEKERVASLEMVDEVEEWELLAAHYCVVWGWKDGEKEGFIGELDRWKAIVHQ